MKKRKSNIKIAGAKLCLIKESSVLLLVSAKDEHNSMVFCTGQAPSNYSDEIQHTQKAE